MAEPKDNETQKRKMLVGTVVSNAMRDTAVVRVERYVKHPKYKKYVRQQKKYAAHDPGNTAQVGDTVTIEETRPLSKTKHFRILKNEHGE